MKKLLALLLATLFVFMLSACKSKSQKPDKDDLKTDTEYSEGNNEVDWNPAWTTQIEENK